MRSLNGSRIGRQTGLIGFEDKNADGRIQFNADPAINEVRVDQDIIVLANPEIANLPNWVVGLVAAGGLAAALSNGGRTSAGYFNIGIQRFDQANAEAGYFREA